MKLVIVLLVVVGLGTVVATIIVGSQTFDGVVADEPFEEGLAWDAQREAREASGVEVEVLGDGFSVGVNSLELGLRGENGARVADARVRVLVTRAHTSASDLAYTLAPGDDGTYHGSIALSDAGSWELVVSVERGGSEAQFRRRIVVSR